MLVECAKMGARDSSWFFLSVPFLCFSLNTCLCIGVGTLSVGESISGDQTIVSEGNGNFELGFFAAGNHSQNYYIGIWYRNIQEMTIVWVANRDKPVFNKNSSQLKLLEDGSLVILNSSQVVVWSPTEFMTTSTSSINSTTVEVALLDSGNLVLRNVLNSSVLIWESFDHPTDTWLPGGKIGLNKLTNESQFLTAWTNSKDPATGFFSLELDPAGSNQLFVLWKGSTKYWTTGIWNGHIFRLIPEMRGNYISNFSHVSNQKENYFTYNMYDSSIISRFVQDVSGQVRQFIWMDPSGWSLFWTEPRQLCEVDAPCMDFGICNQQTCGCLPGFNLYNTIDYSNMNDDCTRNTQLQCANNASVNGEKDGFFKMTNVRLPIFPQSLVVGSAQACELACLNNCYCNAYAYGDNCSIWIGDLFSVEQLSDGETGGQDLYLKLAASELRSLTSGGNKKGLGIDAIAGVVSGVVALLGLLVVLIWTRQWRILVGTSKAVEGSLVPFTYRDLKIATKNFSEKIGGGGFGSVFKGTLLDSTVVAVKKLEGLSQGEKQFRAEVSTIGMIQHVNLVRLCGFCCEGTKRLLVYNFMPKGSLHSHLFHTKKDSEVLDWKTRYQIAVGTARGLAYLHEKCRDCIIHCDIKPENVLLDAEFCPKVSDFGLAKLAGRDFSRVLTTMRGTIGYLAPEWISGVAITAKVDVYSFGMMLFEIISGRRNSNQSDGKKFKYFPIWAASKINDDGEILNLLDYRLEGNVDLAELNRACKVATWCIQDEEIHRPSMDLVVLILEGIVEVNTPPIPRKLQALVENVDEHIVFLCEPSSNQSSQAWSPTSGTSPQAKSTTSSTNSMT